MLRETAPDEHAMQAFVLRDKARQAVMVWMRRRRACGCEWMGKGKHVNEGLRKVQFGVKPESGQRARAS